MKKLLLITLVLVIMTGCCFTQIPTQLFFAGIDSCEFYLPDYTQAVQMRDNCCVEQIVQEPTSGVRLIPGQDLTVTLTGMDCSGNTTSMQFDVIVIDTIPPEFIYLDSTVLIPSGMYQNDVRTFHLYTVIDTIEYGKMNHYYSEKP